uniref:Secreted protein n=1 Tax=Macrostomum lignano TaxID=282301 RepID=A0A1I8FS56_9PLAT
FFCIATGIATGLSSPSALPAQKNRTGIFLAAQLEGMRLQREPTAASLDSPEAAKFVRRGRCAAVESPGDGGSVALGGGTGGRSAAVAHSTISAALDGLLAVGARPGSPSSSSRSSSIGPLPSRLPRVASCGPRDCSKRSMSEFLSNIRTRVCPPLSTKWRTAISRGFNGEASRATPLQ